MAKYPDRRSAAIPALHAAQELHGWCSPEAIEQVAAVMQVTPAYLTSVATLLRHARDRSRWPRTTCTCARTSRARCAAPTSSTRRCSEAAAEDPTTSTCARSSAWARATSRRWPRSTASTSARSSPRTRRRCSRTSRPGGRCCRQAARYARRAPTRSAQLAASRPRATPRSEPSAAMTERCCSTDIDEPGLNTLEVYERRGGYESLRKALQMTPEEVLEQISKLRAARPRRRRLPDGQEGLVPAAGRRWTSTWLQRRRVRAGHVQGPRADAEEPAHADRGDRDRLLRGRDQPRVHLHPRRVRAAGRHPRGGDRRSREAGLHRRATSSAPSTRCRWCCTAAPAPTSAARRPACSTRSRASAATRA